MALRYCRAFKILDDKIVVKRVFLQPGNTAARVFDTFRFPGTLVVSLIVFAEGTHVHHEYTDFGILIVFQRHKGLFGRVHAAHGRAIVMGLVP